jgi:pimeloyl-ACP methyl ester carboxylesterase
MDALRGHLDLSHVGVAGHSVGGMAAAESCIRDARVAACANFDGVVTAIPAYLDSAGRGPQQPFLFVEKPLATVPGESAGDAARRTGFLRDRGNAALASVRTGRSYRVTMTGATHATFSDEEVLTGGSVRQKEMLAYSRAYLVAFFEETLKGIPSALWGQPPDPAIHVEVFAPR